MTSSSLSQTAVETPFPRGVIRDFEAELSLQRLWPRLQDRWRLAEVDPAIRQEFESRLVQHWPRVFRLLLELYGGRYDFFYHLEQILLTTASAWLDRPEDLRAAL